MSRFFEGSTEGGEWARSKYTRSVSPSWNDLRWFGGTRIYQPLQSAVNRFIFAEELRP
jgi:hypothetical protein